MKERVNGSGVLSTCLGVHLYAESVGSGCYGGFMISWAQVFAIFQA
jgi:hypothetical protein